MFKNSFCFSFSFLFFLLAIDDALTTCLLDDVHSLNNREKRSGGTKCTQWELCRQTARIVLTHALSLSLRLCLCLCHSDSPSQRRLSRSRSASALRSLASAVNTSNRFALCVFSCLLLLLFPLLLLPERAHTMTRYTCRPMSALGSPAVALLPSCGFYLATPYCLIICVWLKLCE